MSNPEFDWINVLPEADRKAALASRESFFKGFPVRAAEVEHDAAELRQAGIEGRVAFNRAVAIVDARKETERLLNAAADHIAGTLQQPSDPRAWDQLLIYCPREALERRLAVLKGRQMSDDFCLIHGYEHMKAQFGNPIPYCAACDGERERIARQEAAWLLLHRWENVAKNGGEKWLREHPLVAETTKLLNDEAAASTGHSEAPSHD